MATTTMCSVKLHTYVLPAFIANLPISVSLLHQSLIQILNLFVIYLTLTNPNTMTLHLPVIGTFPNRNGLVTI
jgi:hypothetical protein